jgi:hypothetical protein
MQKLNKEVSFCDAKNLAELSALGNLKNFLKDEKTSLLREDYLEAEHCWVFFRNKEIIVPPESSLGGDCAYAVSKAGEVRQIADLSSDNEQSLAYLQKMSDYFNR